MQTATRLLFNSYVGQIAQLNALDPSLTVIPGTLSQFNVSPVVSQKLQQKLILTSDFMKRINVIPVVEQQGARVGLGTTRSIASRTDTTGAGVRAPSDPTGSDAIDNYFAKKTDYDYAWKYALLDAWAHRPEFQTILRDSILKQKSLDIISIGFNGVNAAATTDRTAYPLLEDVNYGWLYKMRTYAPARCMSHGALDGNFVYVSAVGNADYVNLDALVFDARHNLLAEQFGSDTDLVVIVGRDLVHDKYFSVLNEAGDVATEMVARDVILSARQMGGLPAMTVPKFPANALMITSLSNLSYYWQLGTARRAIKDNPAKDQIDNFESINDAFVIEEYGKACLIEKIKLAPKV